MNEIPIGLILPSVPLYILEHNFTRCPGLYAQLLKGTLMTSDEAFKIGMFDEILQDPKLVNHPTFVKNYFDIDSRAIQFFGSVKNDLQRKYIQQIQTDGYFGPRDRQFITNWFAKDTQELLHKAVESFQKKGKQNY